MVITYAATTNPVFGDVPVPRPQAEARSASHAELVAGNRVRVKVRCVGAPAWAPCRGLLRLTSPNAIVRRGDEKQQTIEIGRTRFDAIAPQSSAFVSVPVRVRARYHLSRRSRTKAVAYVTDELTVGDRGPTRRDISIVRVTRR